MAGHFGTPIQQERQDRMTKSELKQRVSAAIERRGEQIIAIGDQIRKHPELGFKEVKTARLVEDTLARSVSSRRRASP